MMKSSTSEFFFEMHNLNIIWLDVFQFITCNLVFFVFGATFAASNWQFISICSRVVGGEFWGL